MEFVEATCAPTAQEGEEAEGAGLQIFLGEEKIFEEGFVLGYQLFVTVEGRAGFVAEFFELVADAFFGASDGALDGRVDLGDGFVKLADAFFHLAQAAVKFTG